MRKIDKEEAEDIVEDEQWSIPRIVVGLLIIGVILFSIYSYRDRIFPSSMFQTRSEQVAGARTQSFNPEDYSVSSIKSDIKKNLDTLKEQANNLNAQEVATSSPQVQKILNDLKNLQDLPRDQAREACNKVCSQL